jgi:hypothetical protein
MPVTTLARVLIVNARCMAYDEDSMLSLNQEQPK